MNKAPGKDFRDGLSLVQIATMFPDDATAKTWFTQTRWPDGPHCPYCGSTNILSGAKHKTMPYRCREKECAKRFSIRTNTPLDSSNLGFQVWAIAIYLLTTSLKGVSSMKLHRDLGIAQSSAWHLGHRLREGWEGFNAPFAGPVEIDETYIGGKEMNKHSNKRLRAGRGTVGKAIVAGAKDRETNHVRAAVVKGTDAETLQGFVADHAAEGATIYTDDHGGYRGMPFKHEAVRHTTREYVNGQAHTNGRDRVLLGDAQARLPRHLPSYERKAFGPLCWRIRRAAQRPDLQHHRPNDEHRSFNGREAVALRGAGRVGLKNQCLIF